jgi:Rhodopirellula transposase DDE domain
METNEVIKARINTVLPMLNERQSRIYLSAEATSIGWGGKSIIAELSSVTRRTIAKGETESFVGEESVSKNRIRKAGGGRKKVSVHQPKILQAIQDLVSPHTMGNPMNPLMWTSKSIRKIAIELKALNYKVSHEVVRQCLIEFGYSLQANKKTDEGAKNEDRDQQFEHINSTAISFMNENCPVISVDCKKKELIGNYKNNGQEWEVKKQPIEVKVYDFIDKDLGKAVPYGIYDMTKNEGFVNVGISSDTAEFAVYSIRMWWIEMGKEQYEGSKKIYITADGGGSNSTRGRLWKTELQKLATETGLEISVSHFPPGTSKWNKIEHRLFSYISKNWRAKPLTSIEVIVNLIANTTTEKGLKVKAKIDKKQYNKGVKISDEELGDISINRNNFRGEWNYIISPKL